MLQFALVLTVAAIPVAMPTVLSVTMAVGARLLAKKQAIVSKLVAIEELAGVDVLCADKTGTLTQNKLTLGDPFCLDAITADELILAGALASQAANNDTIDLAVLGGLKDKQALKPYQVTHFTPFDPVHKRTEATVKGADGKTFKVTKGAPQVILALSANAAAVKSAVDKAVDDFAARGFRALGVARADGDGKWRLLGVLPLFDPPREDAKSTIATAAEMGVKIKMVTGDALAIAREMAKTLGMGSNILDANTLGDSKTDETAAATKSIENADGFAQVFPEHKFHIVDVLQKHGHIVGMTGDGVNDAPALKKADCGFAVSGATDAARAAASIVLVTPGLIGDHRCDQGEPEDFSADEQLCDLPHRRDAARSSVHDAGDRHLQLLSADGDHDRHAGVAQRRRDPVDRLRQCHLQEPARNMEHAHGSWDRHGARSRRPDRRIRAVLPMATSIFHLGHPQLQTMMYLMLSVAGHLTIFQTRTRGPWWSTRPAWILLAAVLGTQALATLIAVYGAWLVTPIGWKYAGIVWGYAFAWFLVTDPVKLLAYKVLDTVKVDSAPRPEAKTEAKPDAKAETKPQPKARPTRAKATKPNPEAGADNAKPSPQPDAKSAPKAEANAGPPVSKPDAKADDAKPDAEAGPKLEAKAAPQPEAKAEPKPETEPKPQAQTGVATLLDMSLGDLLLAGLIKDPEDAGRIIAAAITQADTPSATAKTPETKAEPKAETEAEPRPGAKAKAPPIQLRRPTSEPMDDTNRANRRKDSDEELTARTFVCARGKRSISRSRQRRSIPSPPFPVADGRRRFVGANPGAFARIALCRDPKTSAWRCHEKPDHLRSR